MNAAQRNTKHARYRKARQGKARQGKAKEGTGATNLHATQPNPRLIQAKPGRWKPDLLRPGIVGMGESTVIRPRPCTKRVPPPFPPAKKRVPPLTCRLPHSSDWRPCNRSLSSTVRTCDENDCSRWESTTASVDLTTSIMSLAEFLMRTFIASTASLRKFASFPVWSSVCSFSYSFVRSFASFVSYVDPWFRAFVRFMIEVRSFVRAFVHSFNPCFVRSMNMSVRSFHDGSFVRSSHDYGRSTVCSIITAVGAFHIRFVCSFIP